MLISFSILIKTILFNLNKFGLSWKLRKVSNLDNLDSATNCLQKKSRPKGTAEFLSMEKGEREGEREEAKGRGYGGAEGGDKGRGQREG